MRYLLLFLGLIYAPATHGQEVRFDTGNGAVVIPSATVQKVLRDLPKDKVMALMQYAEKVESQRHEAEPLKVIDTLRPQLPRLPLADMKVLITEVQAACSKAASVIATLPSPAVSMPATTSASVSVSPRP